MVIGKNRDEEEALDFTALGQTVLRLGADDSSLPNSRRTVLTQLRGKADAVLARTLQFWAASKLKPGDAGSLDNKIGSENVSLRAALDGGAVFRFGARNATSKRRHLMNGYQDGPGQQAWSIDDPSRKDSKTDGRPTYGAGDSVYAFHDLSQAAAPIAKILPYNWSGPPVTNMDAHGLSIDFHTVRDILIRAGSNPASGQSILLDLAGGIVAWLGKDKQGRSITATLDGGVELVIGPNNQGKALRVELTGDLDLAINGNFHLEVSGDFITSATNIVTNSKISNISTSTQHIRSSLVRDTTEAPDIINNQGTYGI
jgi:hypothetical protein